MENRKVSFKDTLRENLGLAVYNTGYERCNANHKWGPALRDHYLVHYVIAGKGTYVFEQKRYTLSAGDLFLVFPGMSVTYTADRDDPWEYCWVGFNGTEARRMLEETGFSLLNPVLHLEHADRLQTYLMNIYQSRGNTAAADADMVGYLYLFLGELMRKTGHIGSINDTQNYVAQAVRYIQYNFSGSLSVTDLASHVGISRSQLYRAFMEKFDLSPHSFLKRYRISEACTLLRRPGLTIGEVANSVGFPDALYFSRVFKEIKGMTPSQYQQEHRVETE